MKQIIFITLFSLSSFGFANEVVCRVHDQKKGEEKLEDKVYSKKFYDYENIADVVFNNIVSHTGNKYEIELVDSLDDNYNLESLSYKVTAYTSSNIVSLSRTTTEPEKELRLVQINSRDNSNLEYLSCKVVSSEY
jgi:hypothetical protein